MIRTFTSNTQKIGEEGEKQAALFLMKQGFVIIERNVPNKYGEIDIIAKKKGAHYFFEVKTGKSGGWINPAENLTPAKLRKFLVSAEHYALVHNIRDYRAQGIIVLLPSDDHKAPSIEIIDLT